MKLSTTFHLLHHSGEMTTSLYQSLCQRNIESIKDLVEIEEAGRIIYLGFNLEEMVEISDILQREEKGRTLGRKIVLILHDPMVISIVVIGGMLTYVTLAVLFGK